MTNNKYVCMTREIDSQVATLEVELSIVKITLAMRDAEVAPLSQIVKYLQDRLTMLDLD